MPKSIEFDGVVHEFPDDFTDADIAAALTQVSPQASHGQSGETPAQMVNVGGRGTGLDLRLSRRRSADALPTIGGGVGAALGGLTSPVTGPVGPAVGAALGGGAGTALRSMVRGESPNANEVIDSGLGQGALQAVTPLGTAAAKGLYKGGVALLPKGIKQAFPNLAETGFREGVALTRRGAEKAERAIGESAGTADAMIASAQAGGAKPIAPIEVLRELRPVGQKIRTQEGLGLPSEMPALMTRAKSFMGRGPLDLQQAQALKKEAQDLATTAYKARDKGAVINSIEALTNEGQARGLRKGLESRVPGLGDVNARTQSLIGVRDAAEHASQTGHVLPRVLGAIGLGGAAGPAGMAPAALAAGVGGTMTTPGGLTATGLALKPIAAHLPSATRIALLLSLLGQEQEQ
jgi:hypothetical protein